MGAWISSLFGASIPPATEQVVSEQARVRAKVYKYLSPVEQHLFTRVTEYLSYPPSDVVEARLSYLEKSDAKDQQVDALSFWQPILSESSSAEDKRKDETVRAWRAGKKSFLEKGNIFTLDPKDKILTLRRVGELTPWWDNADHPAHGLRAIMEKEEQRGIVFKL